MVRAQGVPNGVSRASELREMSTRQWKDLRPVAGPRWNLIEQGIDQGVYMFGGRAVGVHNEDIDVA